MNNSTFQSLFDECQKINFNNFYDDSIDKVILNKLKQLKQKLDQNNYLNNVDFFKTYKSILNFFYIRDLFYQENKNLDLHSLIYKDATQAHQIDNDFDVVDEQSIKKFWWLFNWYNHTSLDLKTFHVTNNIIQYVRKEMNLGVEYKNENDSEYIHHINDLLSFLNSDILNELPIIKVILMIKRLIDMHEILSTDIFVMLINLIMRKYNIDVNGSINFFATLLIKNKRINNNLYLDEINSLPLNEFIQLVKIAYLHSVDISLHTIELVEKTYHKINNTSASDFDLLYPNEFKEVFKTQLNINHNILSLNRIYLTRNIYNQKIQEFLQKRFLVKSNNETVSYINAFLYDLYLETEQYLLDNIY